jgi:hypothetical protein
VSKEEYTGSLAKLARSFVAGDDGRTKRRKGEREKKEPHKTPQKSTKEEKVEVVVGEHQARHSGLCIML